MNFTPPIPANTTASSSPVYESDARAFIDREVRSSFAQRWKEFLVMFGVLNFVGLAAMCWSVISVAKSVASGVASEAANNAVRAESEKLEMIVNEATVRSKDMSVIISGLDKRTGAHDEKMNELTTRRAGLENQIRDLESRVRTAETASSKTAIDLLNAVASHPDLAKFIVSLNELEGLVRQRAVLAGHESRLLIETGTSKQDGKIPASVRFRTPFSEPPVVIVTSVRSPNDLETFAVLDGSPVKEGFGVRNVYGGPRQDYAPGLVQWMAIGPGGNP